MADQDFNINIRVNANTAQVDAIRQSFEKLGAQVQVTNAQAAAGGGGAGGIGDLGRLIGGLTGVGIGGSLIAFVEGLKKASAEISKISDDLDKQGAQLLENAQLFSVQAKHATDASDVIKISDNALKEMEKTQKTLTELQQAELGYAAQISDYLQKQILGRQRLAQMGDYEAARLENLKTAQSQNQQAQAAAIKEIDDAQAAQDRSLEEIIEDTQKAIEIEQKRAANAKQNNDAKTYAEAVNALNRYNQELEKAYKLQAQQFDGQQRDNRATRQSRQDDVDFWQKAVQQLSPKDAAIQRNQAAARQARAEGRERDADMFEKSARDLGGEEQRPESPQEMRDRQNRSIEAGRQKTIDDIENIRKHAGKMPWEVEGGPPNATQELEKAQKAQVDSGDVVTAIHELRDLWT